MNFTLNSTKAKQSESTGGAIKEAGKYLGKITRAEALKSKSGASGVGISFETDDGLQASYLDIWTHNANGDEIFGFNRIMAIMACTKIKSMNVGIINFKKYDFDSKQMIDVQAQGYPDLMGKRIGFLLQQIIDEYNGNDTNKLEIFGVFEAGTDFSASEILDQKTKPEATQKRYEQLMKNPIIDKRKNKPKYIGSSDSVSVQSDSDDIPF
jgi:hypothetical protein